MRDTARSQCLVLLLLAGIAWMCLDVRSLPLSFAGFLGLEDTAKAAPLEPASAEKAPGSEAPAPLLTDDLRPRIRPRIEIKLFRPDREVWHLALPPDANVG